jgi:hypothetical protein
MHCQMWKPPLLIIKEKNTNHAEEKELCHVTRERGEPTHLTSSPGHGQPLLKAVVPLLGRDQKLKH